MPSTRTSPNEVSTERPQRVAPRIRAEAEASLPPVSRKISPDAQDDLIWTRVLASLEAALDKKAADPVVLDLRGHSQLADYFVIVSGRSDTQVQAITDAIEAHLSALGERPLHVEGREHGQWVLIDFGDVVVHVFNEPVRAFYDLERLWSRAPHMELPEPLQSQARGAVGATETA